VTSILGFSSCQDCNVKMTDADWKKRLEDKPKKKSKKKAE
jgi:hypothetical protein